MTNKFFPILFFIINSIVAYSQTLIDSAKNNLLNHVNLYEYGLPLSSCETNFKNLFNNWHSGNITNANEYKLLDFSYVETIMDTIRYNYYRNYFSGGEPVGSSKSSNSSISYHTPISGKDTRVKENYELFVRPGFIYSEFYDQRALPAEARKILTKEVAQQAQELLEREINIDTLALIHCSGEAYRIDTIRSVPDFFWSVEVRKGHLTYQLASTDSLSKNVLDYFLQRKNMDNLTLEEKKALILEELLITRITVQVSFNEKIHFGDKVYLVRFRYGGAIYPVYVICNSESKKVVWDNFFMDIPVHIKK